MIKQDQDANLLDSTIASSSSSSVLFQALGPYTHKTHNTHTKRT